MNKTRAVVAFVFLVFLGIALYLSFSFPKEAKVLPLLVLIPGVPLAFSNLLTEMKSKQSARSQGEEKSVDAGRRHRIYQIFVAAIVLPLLSWLFGITIGLPLFMFTYLRWVSKESWGTVIFSTVLSWIILYLGFEVLMRSNFDKGILFDLISS